MPRTSRRVAESGHYHVMLRGNGKQVIFEDDVDRRVFLDALSRALEAPGLSLLAWCLMTNHVHLLFRDETDCLSSAMHVLATKYAGHFNSRTGHVGSVFDGRFKSVPIESDAQLIAAVRYIHDNPKKAGICPAADYPWSSFGEYAGARDTWGLTEVDSVLDMLGGPDGFLAMSSEPRPNGYCFCSGKRIPEEDVLEIARATLYPLDPRALREALGAERGRALLALKDAGLSLRQIERVTGIGRYSVQKGILLAGGE